MKKARDLNKDRIKELGDLAKLIAVEGVRNNTDLEDLHSGITPSSATGDFSDVKVVTPYGEIDWNRVSRISDKEMRSLMLSVERAIEMVMVKYETCETYEKQMLIKFIKTQRTYDRSQ